MATTHSETGSKPKVRDQRLATERCVLVSAVLASGMAFIDATGLNVAMPALQTEFGATGPQLLWIVNAYSLPVATLLLLGGALGDRFGRRHVFMGGIAGFAAASIACGFAPNAQYLITFRACQGIAAAFMIPGSLALISSTVAPERRGAAIGLWSACSVVMTALGPVLGGALAASGFWRGLFFINVPLAVAALAILSVTQAENVCIEKSRNIDLAGTFFSVVGLGGLNFGLIDASAHGLSSSTAIASLCVGVVGLVLFIVVEFRVPTPMLPLELFRVPAFTAACMLTLTFYSGLYGMLFFLSLNLIQVQGYDAFRAGLAQLPVMLPILVFAPLAGRMLDRRGPRLLLTIGPILAGLGFLLLALPGVTNGPDEFWRRFLAPLAVIGLAMGITVSPLSAVIVSSVPRRHAGLASGINSALSRLSSVLGVAVLGPIVLFLFDSSLARQIDHLPLSAQSRASVSAEAIKLAAAEPPNDVAPDVADTLRLAIRHSYVRAFRTVACLCAAVVWCAAATTAILLRRPPAMETSA